MKEDILTKYFIDNQIKMDDSENFYFESEKPTKGLYYSNIYFKCKEAIEFVDYLYFLKFPILCIELADIRTGEYINNDKYIGKYINETYLEYIERTYKEYRDWIWESDEFCYNISFEYNCDVKNYPILDTSGQILYGKYLNNCIYIDKEQDNNLYNITMWNKDNNQEQQQFIFNSEKEVENFFKENDMIIKWEKLEE